MRSTARAAAASDPAKNFHFSRRWSEPTGMSEARTYHQTSRPREVVNCDADEVKRIFARFVNLSAVSA